MSHHSSLAEAETEAAAACEDVESLERPGRSLGLNVLHWRLIVGHVEFLSRSCHSDVAITYLQISVNI